MCITFIITNFPPHSPIKKLILFNRDEALARPSLPLSKHEDGFFYGIDIRSQGTWLAFSSTKFALLTNFHDLSFKPVTDSQYRRGRIVQGILKQKSPLKTKAQLAQAFTLFINQRKSFNGFNLVLGNMDSDRFGYYCNGDQSPFIYEKAETKKYDGVTVFALSNCHALKKKYPKTDIYQRRLKRVVDNWLEFSGDESFLMEQLKKIMTHFTDPGVNSEPADSLINDVFIRPYFVDNRGAVCGTLGTTFIVVKEKTIEATEISWDYSRNEEIKQQMAELEELRAKYLRTEDKQEKEETYKELMSLSTKTMEAFKAPKIGSETTITLNK